MFTENTSRNTRKPILQGVGTKEPTAASSSGDEEDLKNDSDDDYNGNGDNSDDDYSCDDDGSDDQGNGDDKSNDDYSCDDDDDSDYDGDIGNDGEDDDGGTDNLCAICDNGGKLLSCVGQCRRAFHPREKDGIDSNCESLGLTTAQLQEIDHYMCKNCEYKQHQCFNCGDLEPSDGANAKVFQCYKASCGHFYHPSCIAKLLEPDDTDGALKLENKIATGMSFTCPVHWCSKCGKMEDGTQIALWLAVCRRCPVSYHKKCLPRNISFESKRGKSIRAWHLDDRIIMYCGHHEIEDTIATPCRNHIRLPSVTEMDTIGAHCMDHTPSVAEIDRTRDLAQKKAQATGKRKMSTDQGSTGTTEMSNKLCREEGDQPQKEATDNSRELISTTGGGVLNKDTIHSNLMHNDEQDNFSVQEQAEENKNDTKSGKEKETHKGENAYERDLLFQKEKIPGKESNKSGLTIGGFTSGHVDGRSPEKLAYAKTTTSSRRDTHQDCEWDGDQQVDGSFAGKQALKNPQCSDTHKATEIHTSGDKSRMREEHKEQATVCKILNLEKNGGNSDMETGRDACYKVQGPQYLHSHTEDPKFRNRDLISSSTSKGHPRHNDDQRPLKSPEFKSSDGRGSGRTKQRNNIGVNSYRDSSPLERRNPQKRSRVYSPEGRRMDYHNSSSTSKGHPWHNDDQRPLKSHEFNSSDGRGSGRTKQRNNIGVNSYRDSSPLERGNPQKRSRVYSPEGRRMDYHNSYPGSNNQHRYDRWQSEDYCDGDRTRHCCEDYSSDGDDDRRRLSRREDYSSDGGRTRFCREDYSSDVGRGRFRGEDHLSDGRGDRRMLSYREDYSSDGGRGRFRREDHLSDGRGDRRMLSYREDHSSDGGRGRFRREDHLSDGRGDRRMLSYREDYCSDSDVGRRRFSPRQSDSPSNFSSSYSRTEYGGTSHGPPSYGGRHDPYMNTRKSKQVHYAMDRRAVPFHGDPPNVEYGRYNAMDHAPVVRYSRQEDTSGAYGPPTDAGMGEEAQFDGGRFRDYGARRDYGPRNRLNSDDGPWAARSVTDRYIPHLDRTNRPIRSQGGLHDAR